jgi:hypothetical protein
MIPMISWLTAANHVLCFFFLLYIVLLIIIRTGLKDGLLVRDPYYCLIPKPRVVMKQHFKHSDTWNTISKKDPVLHCKERHEML